MTISPTIYDWPSVVPVRQLFHAGGQAVEGGYTSGGVRVLSPEPGGFSWLEVEFGYQQDGETDSLISWLMSKIANGNVFRIPIRRSPQLVPAKALGIDIAEYDPLRRFGLTETITPSELDGLPWGNGQSWSNGQPWQFNPLALAAGASLAGTTTLTVDMGELANGLRHGHVIGHKDVAYLVDDVSYAGSIATVTVDPQLRKDVASGDLIRFRPKATFSAINPEAFRGLYEPGDLIALGSARFGEAIV
jgi:hypothetical protein